MVLHTRGKLIGHLRGHERVRNLVLFKIFIKGDQVKAYLLRDDVQFCSNGKGAIDFHW